MIIVCKHNEVLINGHAYRNRPINLNNVIEFDKAYIDNKMSSKIPAIKFTSIITNRNGKGEIFDWLFESETQRDAAMQDIMSRIGFDTVEPIKAL